MQCCNNIQMDVLKGLIYRVEKSIMAISKDTLNLFLYGYPRKYTDEVFYKLQRYLVVLERIEKSLLFDSKGCIDCDCWETLVGKLNSILPKERIKCEENVLLDDSGVKAWELAHPYCVSRTRWEELAYSVCSDIKFNIKATEIACNLTFDLATNSISCDTTAALSLYQQLCDIDAKTIRTEEECEIDYNLLLEKHPGCNITYGDYTKLLECNMSYDIIDQILCDTSSIYFKNGIPTIKTLMGEYSLTGDLSFNAVIAPSDCAATLCKDSGSCTLDGGQFISRLLSDYNLTDEEKEQILAKIK